MHAKVWSENLKGGSKVDKEIILKRSFMLFIPASAYCDTTHTAYCINSDMFRHRGDILREFLQQMYTNQLVSTVLMLFDILKIITILDY
jgi:hypothetical protein